MTPDMESVDIGPVTRAELALIVEAIGQRVAYLRAMRRDRAAYDALLERLKGLEE
jgi:hypothetical protein